MPIRDLTGQQFHHLRAIAVAGRDPQGRVMWRCHCVCGNEKVVASRHLVQGRQRTCGCRRDARKVRSCLGKKGSAHPRWRGGRGLRDGYVWVRVAESVYVPEHRLVVECVLGRRLRADEIVHHRNEIRTDNRPDNLQVMTRSEHAKIHGLGSATRGRAIQNAERAK